MLVLPFEDARAYGYDVKLKSGVESVCAAYAKALTNATYETMARCERPQMGATDGFQSIGRKPLPAEEVGRLFEPVVRLLAGENLRQRAGSQATDAPFYVRRQQQAIEAGQPLRFFHRFEPRPDINNDGTPDDVVIWKDIGVPCGVVRYEEPEFSKTHALILDAHGNPDAGLTRAVFGFRSKEWLGDSFGVFQFKGDYYFDTFNSYTNLRQATAAEEQAILDTLSVYRHKGGETRLVCEISVSKSTGHPPRG
jgi:hypothetical protein